jgi:lipid-binding SYLF domain-containing protein
MNGKILSAGVCSLLLLGAPAFAANSGAPVPAQTQNTKAATAQHILTRAANTIRQVKADKYFAKLLNRAKGVVIFSSVTKGAVIAGGAGGEGVLLSRRNGRWSDPAFIGIGSISFGPQVGGKAGPMVMLLMTDKALYDFSSRNNFSLNANAGLTIVNYSTKGQGGFGKGDVIVWSGAGGAFVGASASVSDITADTARDAAFYGKRASTEQIMKGDVHSGHAQPLLDALSAS